MLFEYYREFEYRLNSTVFFILQETFWTATEICLESDPRKRALIIESFVRIARICKESCNFFSMFAIVGGLNLAPVQRLKRTWEEVPSRAIDSLREMEEIMSPYQNMKNYRERMQQAMPPIVPVLRTWWEVKRRDVGFASLNNIFGWLAYSHSHGYSYSH